MDDKIYAVRLNITNSETWKDLEMGTRVENKLRVPNPNLNKGGGIGEGQKERKRKIEGTEKCLNYTSENIWKGRKNLKCDRISRVLKTQQTV